MRLEIVSILAEIDAIVKQAADLRKRSKFDDCSDLPDDETVRMGMRLCATLDRVSPRGGAYGRTAATFIEKHAENESYCIRAIPGMLLAMRDDYAAGRLRAVEELVHADTFADFLDMARHLIEGGYKDAAAVIAGSTLEAHLRALCAKHGVAVAMSDGSPKKASTVNDELVKAGAYEKGDQKSVTAWLDLRNHAAHGHYDKYTKDQVALLIDSVRDFINRVPA